MHALFNIFEEPSLRIPKVIADIKSEFVHNLFNKVKKVNFIIKHKVIYTQI